FACSDLLIYCVQCLVSCSKVISDPSGLPHAQGVSGNRLFRETSVACTKSVLRRRMRAMSMEVHVFFRGKLPSIAAFGRMMKELGFPLSVRPATGSLEGHKGYLPMRIRRNETGAEFDVFEGRAAIDEFDLKDIDESLDRVGNFRWGGDEEEMLAALCGMAALAKLTNGIAFDDAGGRLLSPDEAVEMAKQELNAVAAKETKQFGTRPADIRRYLKPLLQLRPDLVLIDRMLIIRPVRHLLRGAFFNRTSDKHAFEIWRFLEPLYDGVSGGGW